MDLKNGNYKLDKNIPVPLYYQLKKLLIDEISNNRIKLGDSIPTEAEFSEHLGISRPTIRQALSEMASEGYLQRLKGKGTFVSKPKIDARFFQQLQSFNSDMNQKGLNPTTQVLDLKVIKGIADICEKLDIDVEDELVYLRRVRFADDEPVVYLETYLPYKYCKGIIEEDFVNNSLYSIMEEKYSIKIFKVVRKIEAVNADDQVAKLLHMKKNQALCLVKTTAYTEQNIPSEYSIARYRGDRNLFSVELYRG
jgi:GntR family transcriptional regulator